VHRKHIELSQVLCKLNLPAKVHQKHSFNQLINNPIIETALGLLSYFTDKQASSITITNQDN